MEPTPGSQLTDMSLTLLSPSSCHLQMTQDLYASASLPASLPPRQASDNSRRAKVEAE